MSLKKELKEKQNVSFIDLFEILFPDAKTKYYDLFCKIIENSLSNYGEVLSNTRNYFMEISNKSEQIYDHINKFSNTKIMELNSLMSVFENDCEFDIEILRDFIKNNERRLIEKTDLTKYNNYDEIVNQVSMSKIKQLEKELEKQVIKIHEDDEWLVIKPLSYLSSVKYGYGTKWCTAMNKDSSYFRRYTNEGILLYFINKIDGNKVGLYYDMTESIDEISFWNIIDKRIDSIQSGISPNLITLVLKHINQNKKTNYAFVKEMLGDNTDEINKYIYNEDEISRMNDKKSKLEKFLDDGGTMREEIEMNSDIFITRPVRGLFRR